MLHDIVKTPDYKVVCEGSGGALGHPRVYLEVKKEGFIICPYCSKRFELDSTKNPQTDH